MMARQTSDNFEPSGEAFSEEPSTRPRLFILSDLRLLRDGLVSALSQDPSVAIIGSSDLSMPSGEICRLRPDVLLLDVAPPRGPAISLPIRQILPNLKIIAIAVAEVDHEILACAKAGISGFVSRDGSIRDVIAAVHGAVRGELICSPHTAALLFSQVAMLSAARIGPLANGTLTRREGEIVLLLSEGLSNKEIARRLQIQNATVKNHIHSILGKLQVRRRGEAAAYFHRSATGPAAASARPAVG